MNCLLKEMSVISLLWHRFPVSKWNCWDVAQEQWGGKSRQRKGFSSVFAIWEPVWSGGKTELVSRIYLLLLSIFFFFFFSFIASCSKDKSFPLSLYQSWRRDLGFDAVKRGIFSVCNRDPLP